MKAEQAEARVAIMCGLSPSTRKFTCDPFCLKKVSSQTTISITLAIEAQNQ